MGGGSCVLQPREQEVYEQTRHFCEREAPRNKNKLGR